MRGHSVQKYDSDSKWCTTFSTALGHERFHEYVVGLNLFTISQGWSVQSFYHPRASAHLPHAPAATAAVAQPCTCKRRTKEEHVMPHVTNQAPASVQREDLNCSKSKTVCFNFEALKPPLLNCCSSGSKHTPHLY